MAEKFDVQSLLSSPERNYLIRNNGDQVAVSTLNGKKVGLYFSASWLLRGQSFPPNLVDVYDELAEKGDFEIVFISYDEDEESFNRYFSMMPWLAVPYTDTKTREALDGCFKVRGIPNLVCLDERGKVLTDDGVLIIGEYGSEGYPFTPERVKEIKDQEEEARKNQSLRTILESPSRNYISTADGERCLLPTFSGRQSESSDFTGTLVKVYNELKANDENFEIVMISLDDNEESFNKEFSGLPWLSLPFKDKKCEKLVQYFELSDLPTLVIIGPDGKTLHPNVVDAVEEHGVIAYPFTPNKFAELEKIEEAKHEAQTLESVLVSGDLDFVLGKDGANIPVSDLVGKHILLYFSAHWCPPCRAFTPELAKTYHEIKTKHEAFEVIFVSSDRDQASYDEYYSTMSWLSLPFGDKRIESLSHLFKVNGIPLLVALGPTGKIITTETRELIMLHGAEAFPFDDEHMFAMEAKFADMAKDWPNKVKHDMHPEHELVLTHLHMYTCGGCDKEGKIWAYNCEDCNFYLHPDCALKETNGKRARKNLLKYGLIICLLPCAYYIPVSDLVGKHILLYFSAHWCPPCRAFTPELAKTYHEIKTKHEAFEVIFISSDRDQASYDEYYSTMSWLSLPFGDKRIESLSHLLKVNGIPSLVALGPTGKIITTETRELIMLHGAEAFPFDDEHMFAMEAKFADMAKDWPNKVKHDMHPEHELVLTRLHMYTCGGCDKEGKIWAYNCEDCNFYLHPDCALKETNGKRARKNLLKYGLIICLLPCAYYVIRSFRGSLGSIGLKKLAGPDCT
ncbi:DC1 domain-containing protein [Artemisia annua]|uniref:protein-disulfide reductase n=1 Tax=Artemisia annua TaxID=35608 RepID=A0A2U1PA44_ARTAN|nr:DC1 domain-containing protein [Artemisia annua]